MKQSPLPSFRSPRSTGWLLGSACLFLAWWATPSFLIRSDLMSGSLAHVDPLVRSIGHLTVLSARAGLLVIGIGLLITSLLPRQGSGDRPGDDREVARRDTRPESVPVVLNSSFGSMFVIWFAALCVSIFGVGIWDNGEFSNLNRRVLPIVSGFLFLAAAGLGLGLAFRRARFHLGRLVSCLLASTALGGIGLGFLGMESGSGLVFGMLATDVLTVAILACLLGSALVRGVAMFRRWMGMLGLPMASPGLALGACLSVSICDPVLGAIWGFPAGLETGNLRVLILSWGIVCLFWEARIRPPLRERIIPAGADHRAHPAG